MQKLQRKYPELRQDIQEDIESHLRASERTRAADRRDVLQVLEEWQSVGVTLTGDLQRSEIKHS